MMRDNRQTRRMLDRMGLNMDEVPEVEEVLIRTATKEIYIKNASVSEIKAKDIRMFQVTGTDVEEKVREKPKFTEDDVMLVAQQANVPRDSAYSALVDAEGDLARAILSFSS